MSAGDWKDFYQAAVDGDLALVQHHLSEGVNPNYQHPEILRTALVASLVEGHADVAHYLLAHGASPHLVSELDNLSPLQAAQKHGHQELTRLLFELGAEERRQPFWWRWLPV
ncbi:ankyrin repeat domain-containing protein [Leptospira sp. 96542]|nr:ankyrin repeat domain-containing protein [Leptospira sp. 96542]